MVRTHLDLSPLHVSGQEIRPSWKKKERRPSQIVTYHFDSYCVQKKERKLWSVGRKLFLFISARMKENCCLWRLCWNRGAIVGRCCLWRLCWNRGAIVGGCFFFGECLYVFWWEGKVVLLKIWLTKTSTGGKRGTSFFLSSIKTRRIPARCSGSAEQLTKWYLRNNVAYI